MEIAMLFDPARFVLIELTRIEISLIVFIHSNNFRVLIELTRIEMNLSGRAFLTIWVLIELTRIEIMVDLNL